MDILKITYAPREGVIIDPEWSSSLSIINAVNDHNILAENGTYKK